MSDAAPKPKAKGKRGGRRAGAGRKPTKVTEFTQKLEAAVDEAIGEKALGLVENLVHLATGGYERVTDTRELASTITREVVVLDVDGKPKLDARGNAVTTRQPAFPDAEPGKMVVIRRVVEIAEPDRAANEYLLNRRLGKPKQAVEVSGLGGGPIPISIEAALDWVYGEEHASTIS